MDHEFGALAAVLSKLFNVWSQGKSLDQECISASAVREAWAFLVTCVVLMMMVEYQRYCRKGKRAEVMAA